MKVKILKKFEPFGASLRYDDSIGLEATTSGLGYSSLDIVDQSASFSLSGREEVDPEGVRNKETYTEEELYVRDNLVVWSKGGKLIKSFQFPASKHTQSRPGNGLVRQALWAYFKSESLNELGITTAFSKLNSKFDIQQMEPASQIKELVKVLCVLLTDKICLLFHDGRSHSIHCPFEIDHIWALNVGIIIEKYSPASPNDRCLDQSTIDSSKTLLYLAHPYDDFQLIHLPMDQMKMLEGSSHEILFVNNTEKEMPFIVTQGAATHQFWVWGYTFETIKFPFHQEQTENHSSHQNCTNSNLDTAYVQTKSYSKIVFRLWFYFSLSKSYDSSFFSFPLI